MKKLKQYTNAIMMAAYKAVRENHMKVDRAAVTFGIPKQTLRDMVLNKVNVNAKSGKDSLFAHDEELSGKAYLKSMTPLKIQARFRKAGILPFDATLQGLSPLYNRGRRPLPN
ncbi:hypothetical protein DPMN_007001 [Dreissena polymorpha]|uniref:HTH psq-type domain-containing protein n=1 Tax=Dreissena polymorpha TaxID=45954 RepID=A0A9D4MSX3_DREPO|nr:hypothetical protein DPMN_007001 [Dreissena polymorpha]